MLCFLLDIIKFIVVYSQEGNFELRIDGLPFPFLLSVTRERGVDGVLIIGGLGFVGEETEFSIPDAKTMDDNCYSVGGEVVSDTSMRGNAMPKVLPAFNLLFAQTFPLCASIMDFTINSPNPTPGISNVYSF